MTARRHGMARWALRLSVAVALLASSGAAVGKENRPQTVTPQALDALVEQYRDAGLPLPPADAPLVFVPMGDMNNHPVYVIGFKLAATDANALEKALVGTQTVELYTNDPKLHPRPLNPARDLPTAEVPYEHWKSNAGVFPVNNWLALAIQCRQRGYTRLAHQIFLRGLARNEAAGQQFTPLGDGGPRDALAATAWNHWMNILCTEGTDRREILVHLKKLSAGFPALDGPLQRDYLESLRLAAIPGKETADPVEKLIDDLVDHLVNGGSGNDPNNPEYAELQDLGFRAVPALIAHLDDRRLTRSVAYRDNGRFAPRCVNELVRDLLGNIAGTKETPLGSPGQPPDRPADKEAVARWWAKASAMGEETYMTSYTFPPTELSLQITAGRYPHHLGEMYERSLKEQPEGDCQAMLQAIINCGQLAREERRRLLREGVTFSGVRRNFEAISAWYEFDRTEADAVLIEKLDHWPVDAAKPYTSQCPEAMIGNYVTLSDSAEVWQAFERALFRASVAFRMEILKNLASSGSNGMPYDVRRLSLLDLLLDDEEVRVIRAEDQKPGGKFEDYPVTDDTRRISVRNFVAGLLGTLLDVKPPPGSEHNERWWAKYRADVRAAIDQRARAAAEDTMVQVL